MKTARLIYGIIACVFCPIIALQSLGVVIWCSLSGVEEVSHNGGFYLAGLLLLGGILSIATRKQEGCAIVCFLIYAFAAIIGYAMAGPYFKDLYIWTILCVILSASELITILLHKNPAAPPKYEEYRQFPEYKEFEGFPDYGFYDEPPESENSEETNNQEDIYF